MPFITVELVAGRTLDQHRAFVAAVTDAAVETLNAKRENVRIRLVEFERNAIAYGGVLDSDRQ